MFYKLQVKEVFHCVGSKHIEGLLQLGGHRHLTENKDQMLWVQSPATHDSKFSTLPDCKKINKAPSVRVIVICSDQRLL